MNEHLDYLIRCVILFLLIITLSKVKSIERTVEAMATAMQVEVAK